MKKAHLKKAHKVLEKLKKEALVGGRSFGTATFAGVFDKKPAQVYIRAACHASLSSIGKGSIAVVSLVRVGGVTQKQAEIFYDWLFNESPWQDIFVLKNAKEVLKLGGVICETKFPSNLVAGALFATRGLWEHPNTIAFFADLTTEDKKLNKNLALISSMWCRESNVGQRTTYIIGMNNAGHWPLSGEQSEKYVSNFVKNKPDVLREDFCINSTYRAGYEQCVYPIWGKHKLEERDKCYKKKLEKIFSKDKKAIIKVDDRFGGRYNYIGYTERKKFITHMAKALREVQKGLKIAV